ncbi:MAG: hypothetical protein IPK17_39505 [Chloroflexi bacterium]|uniref:hypothetical protein n=1 Tax=Candidatus Flexifilum breve TaxID=3140694 RepID=UPI003134B38E|nr:hypothetical protein [Chloroflexota bacterium]
MQPRISQIWPVGHRFRRMFRFYRDARAAYRVRRRDRRLASFHDAGRRFRLFRRDLMAAVVETRAKPPKADAQDSVGLPIRSMMWISLRGAARERRRTGRRADESP